MPDLEGVLRTLETLDREYILKSVSNEHSFGRIPGEKEVRLWQVPRTTGEFLYSLVKLCQSKTILEIGTSAGYSALWLAKGASNHGGKVYTIEIFPPKIELAKESFKKSGLKNIELIEGEAKQIIKSFKKPIDLLFLDADKENYAFYFQTLRRLLVENSIIIADNAVNYGHLMISYFKVLESDKGASSILLPFDNGLMLTTIKKE